MWNKILEGTREAAGYFLDELKLIFTDAGAILFFVLAMFIYPLLYVAGYGKEVLKELPVAVVDLDHTPASRQYSRMLDATELITVTCKPGSLKEAEQLFFDGKVKGVVLIPDAFEKDVFTSKQTNVTVYSDASFFLLYKQVYTGASYTNSTFGAGVEIKRMLAEGKSFSQALEQQEPVKVDVYNLYNPSGGYASFVMPGVIFIVMQQTLLIGIGVMGGTIREKKIFMKLNGKAKHRVGSVRLVVGKLFAYFLVYFFNALFTFVIFHHWFALPDRGNLPYVLLLFVPYIMAVSGLGLAISMFFKERVHAVLFLVFLSPMLVFVSGISWPSSALPPVLYWIAHVFPSTSVVPAYLRLRVCGASFTSVLPEFTFLLVQAVVYFYIATLSYRLSIRRIGGRIGK